MAKAYIALGSNLGDRAEILRRAVELLRQSPGIWVSRVSSFIETAPVGGPPGQGFYLNGAAELETSLAPPELLRALLDIEAKLGRVREVKNGPRTLDLDLLLYEGQTGSWPDPPLELPHPRMHERRFVLQPLAEIAPEALHPTLKRHVRDLLAELAHVPAPIHGAAGARSPDAVLHGLRAMVTGSTSGIGRAIALHYAEAGADVLIHGRRSAARAQEVTQACQFHGVRAGPVLADLRDDSGLDDFVDRAWSVWNGLDIWVNNAGTDTLTGAASRWSFEKKLAELWAVDVRATMLLSRAVGRRMKKQGGGVILTIGWDQAETGMEGDSGELFAATKGSVMSFTRSLALSLAPEVRVNCIAPGWIRTAWGAGASQPWQERVRRETPLARWGTPEDVARAALWLASPAAAYITGQIVRVNGGAVR